MSPLPVGVIQPRAVGAHGGTQLRVRRDVAIGENVRVSAVGCGDNDIRCDEGAAAGSHVHQPRVGIDGDRSSVYVPVSYGVAVLSDAFPALGAGRHRPGLAVTRTSGDHDKQRGGRKPDVRIRLQALAMFSPPPKQRRCRYAIRSSCDHRLYDDATSASD